MLKDSEEYKQWVESLEHRRIGKWDAGDTAGVTMYSIKWFLIWTFKGLLIATGAILVITLFLALGMSQAKRDSNK